MLEIRDGLYAETDNNDEYELCVHLAVRMATQLPDDIDQGKIVLDMVEKVYAVLTDLRQTRDRTLPG
jgi:hypothetical protein